MAIHTQEAYTSSKQRRLVVNIPSITLSGGSQLSGSLLLDICPEEIRMEKEKWKKKIEEKLAASLPRYELEESSNRAVEFLQVTVIRLLVTSWFHKISYTAKSFLSLTFV